jgi:hypothetical protein
MQVATKSRHTKPASFVFWIDSRTKKCSLHSELNFEISQMRWKKI